MKALQIQLAEVRAMGYNCPFVAKGVMTHKRPNEIYWKKLLSITRMTVLNWENSTKGFFTRTRGNERSELDMILADKEAIGRIKVNILESVNLGSDHCVVELTISTRP